MQALAEEGGARRSGLGRGRTRVKDSRSGDGEVSIAGEEVI